MRYQLSMAPVKATGLHSFKRGLYKEIHEGQACHWLLANTAIWNLQYSWWNTTCQGLLPLIPADGLHRSIWWATVGIQDACWDYPIYQDSTLVLMLFPPTTFQEFLAHGLSNVIPSFFFCIPSAAAMGRTALLFSTGAKTQVTIWQNWNIGRCTCISCTAV